MRRVSLLIIRDIESNKYIIAEYVNLNIYVLNRYLDSRLIKVLFKYIIFVINNLRVKMLIKINIFIFKDIDFVISTRTNYIDSYNTTFKLIITSSIKPFIKQNVIFEKSISILARFYLVILIENIVLSIDNDFLFEPIKDYSIALFIAIIDSLFYAVLIRNDFDYIIYLSRKLQLGSIIDLEINKYYYLNNFKEV